ncbi:MAG: glycosyltransferase [Ferrimicrobium sp.]
MRLVIVSYHASPAAVPGSGVNGGMNVYVRGLASHLARRGVHCDIYTRRVDDSEIPSRQLEPGMWLHTIPAGREGVLSTEESYLAIREFGDRLLDRVASDPNDIVAVHGNYWLSGIAAHLVKHELDVPMLTTFHTLERAKQLTSRTEESPLGSVRAYQEHRILGCSDAVLVSGRPEALWLRELYSASVHQIRNVPLGVDRSYFAPGDRRLAKLAIGASQERPLLLYVGRVQHLKGTALAVATLGELGKTRDAELVIVGGPSGPDGDDELRRIDEVVERYGLGGRVRLVPPQPHELLATYYRAADVCVVPSETESFGLVALEAGACGTPVVATDVGGLSTLIDDGLTGILVRDRSAKGFALAIEHLLERPSFAQLIGARAARKAMEYSWRASAGHFLDVVDEMNSEVRVSCMSCA